MATYDQIQAWVKQHRGYVPKTCWIAHCKDLNGLNPRIAPNRRGQERLVPCPEEKRPDIEAAFRHFGMIR